MSKLTIGYSHIGITVPDISKTVAFFETVGFSKVGAADDYPAVFLSNGSVILTVWQTKVENPVSFDRKANVGLHHLAINVPSMDALHQVHSIVSKLSDVTIEFPPQSLQGTPTTHMMCFEPGGVRVEFVYREEPPQH